MITYLAKLLSPWPIVCVGTDLNPWACEATIKTAKQNGISNISVLKTSIANGLRRGDKWGLFDVIFYNPPYVPTPEPFTLSKMTNIKSGEDLLEAAWAGGQDGRYWIDRVLPQIDGLLSPNGLFYMIALDANKPHEIMNVARIEWNLASEIVIKRRAGIENLVVIKFWRSIM